jgi:cytochrome c biogenesis protein CcdA/DsbC/DsbD-like thiol-disulfide interchange protein
MMGLLLAITLLLTAQDLPGAKARKEKPVVKVLAVRPEKSDAKPGDVVKVAFELEIPKTWHIYAAGKKPLFGNPTVFSFENAEIAGPIVEPPPRLKKEEGIGDIDFHEGKITITVPLKLKGGPVSGRIDYQICDPNVCFDNTTPFRVPLAVQAGGGLTQEPDLPEVKILSAKPSKAEIQAGETFVLEIEIVIPKGFHIYPTYPTTTGEVTAVEFPGVEPAGKPEEPKAKVHPAEGVLAAYDYHEGAIELRFPLRIKPDAGAKPVLQPYLGVLTYQICDPKTCTPMKTPISFQVRVLEGQVPPERASKGAAGEAASEFERRGLGWLLGLSVLGGLISLVMPCVYPLIPITITYFVKQAGVSRGTGLVLSSAYAAGIVLNFTVLGFLLTLLLGAQGAQIFASNPWVNLTMAALFMVFALSLLGLFEIQLPAALTSGLTGSGPKSGVFGAFVLGLLFSVVSFTCTIPIAATILGVAASGEHRLAGLLAMLVYSGTMAVPFLILGLFPSMVKELPKSGGWLHVVKVSAGFFEIALAAAYIWKADFVWGWGLFDRGLVLSIWVAVCFVTSTYLLGLFRMKGDGEAGEIGFTRVASALLFGVLAFFLIGGLLGRPVGVFNVVLPPEEKGATVGKVDGAPMGPKVYERLDDAEAAAKKENKPVFVEFTGYT